MDDDDIIRSVSNLVKLLLEVDHVAINSRRDVEDSVDYWKSRALSAEKKLKKYKREIVDICRQFTFNLQGDDIGNVQEIKSSPNVIVSTSQKLPTNGKGGMRRNNTHSNITTLNKSTDSLNNKDNPLFKKGSRSSLKLHDFMDGTLSQEINNESIIKHHFRLSNLDQSRTGLEPLIVMSNEAAEFFIEEPIEQWLPDDYYVKVVPDIYRTKYFGNVHFNFFVCNKSTQQNYIVSVMDDKDNGVFHCLKTMDSGYIEYDIKKVDGMKYSASKIQKILELSVEDSKIYRVINSSETHVDIRNIEVCHRQKKAKHK